VNLLLDTHVLLWWMAGDPRLRGSSREAIEGRENQVAISAASVWEAAIKRALGKLTLDPAEWQATAKSQGFSELPVRTEHAWFASELPRHHDDPFDRMLIAQAILEGLTVITGDRIFERYPVATLRLR
jgi:PIN domain nuclease of toxin-antitoxin system